MKRSTTIKLFIPLILFSCSSNDSMVKNTVNEKKQIKKTSKKVISKNKKVVQFKNEISILADSATYYFNKAISEVESGIKPENISVASQISNLEKNLDYKTKAFSKETKNLNLTEAESRKIFGELNELFIPMKKSYDKLNMLKKN